MTKCIHRIVSSSSTISIAICIFLLSGLNHLHALNSTSNLGTLRVLTVRKIADDDPKLKKSDYIGATTRIRLRFEAPKDSNVYIYMPSECPPEGYLVERQQGTITWLASLTKKVPSASPGFEALRSQLGDGWVFLPAGAAIEWDVDTEPTQPGVQKARSVFVAREKGSSGTEVLSDWFETAPSSDATSAAQR